MEERQFQVFVVRILVQKIISNRTLLHIQNIWFQCQGAFFCVCHLALTRHVQRRHFPYGEQLICSSSIFLPLQDSTERARAWQEREGTTGETGRCYGIPSPSTLLPLSLTELMKTQFWSYIIFVIHSSSKS